MPPYTGSAVITTGLSGKSHAWHACNIQHQSYLAVQTLHYTKKLSALSLGHDSIFDYPTDSSNCWEYWMIKNQTWLTGSYVSTWTGEKSQKPSTLPHQPPVAYLEGKGTRWRAPQCTPFSMAPPFPSPNYRHPRMKRPTSLTKSPNPPG